MHLTKILACLCQGKVSLSIKLYGLGQMMELIGGEKFCPHCFFGSAILKLTRLSYHKFIYTAESSFLLV